VKVAKVVTDEQALDEVWRPMNYTEFARHMWTTQGKKANWSQRAWKHFQTKGKTYKSKNSKEELLDVRLTRGDKHKTKRKQTETRVELKATQLSKSAASKKLRRSGAKMFSKGEIDALMNSESDNEASTGNDDEEDGPDFWEGKDDASTDLDALSGSAHGDEDMEEGEEEEVGDAMTDGEDLDNLLVPDREPVVAPPAVAGKKHACSAALPTPVKAAKKDGNSPGSCGKGPTPDVENIDAVDDEAPAIIVKDAPESPPELDAEGSNARVAFMLNKKKWKLTLQRSVKCFKVLLEI